MRLSARAKNLPVDADVKMARKLSGAWKKHRATMGAVVATGRWGSEKRHIMRDPCHVCVCVLYRRFNVLYNLMGCAYHVSYSQVSPYKVRVLQTLFHHPIPSNGAPIRGTLHDLTLCPDSLLIAITAKITTNGGVLSHGGYPSNYPRKTGCFFINRTQPFWASPMAIFKAKHVSPCFTQWNTIIQQPRITEVN